MSTRDYVDPLTGRAPFEYAEPEVSDNLLFVSTDMVPQEFWNRGPYSAIRRTPHLDRLALEGSSFSNAFATAPVCSPSRAAYLTGRHSYIMTNSERGHDGHDMHLRETDTIFPEYLSRVGYHTRHVGKSHVGRHKFMDAFGENDSPWDRWSPPWFDDDSYLSYLRDRGLGPITFDRSIYGASPAGGEPGNFYGGWIAPQEGLPFPIEGTYPWYLVERAIATLESRPSRDQPFYLQLDFFGPHQPFAIPGGFEERERDIRAAVPHPVSYQLLKENGYKAPWLEPRVHRIYRENWGLQDEGTVEDYLVANVLQYEIIDLALGRLLEYLDRHNLYSTTTIVYTADHGEMNCNLGLLDKGAFLNPHDMRVPLVIKPAVSCQDLFPPGSASDVPVSLIDIAPTICDLAGIAPADRTDGFPLQATLRGDMRPVDRPILAEVWAHVIPNPCVATVFLGSDGSRYLFSFNICDDISELYRLDPSGRAEDELKNLFVQEDSGSILEEAIRYLDSILAADERWKGYHAYGRLVFAKYLGAGGDMQRFL